MRCKCLKYISSIAIIFLIFIVYNAESAFMEGSGVRPMGMAGAFVAIADDTWAIKFNPAGLGQLKRTEITASYDRLYAGLGEDGLGRGAINYVFPSRNYGSLALSLDLLHVPLYRESTITFGYATSFNNLYLGANIKGLFARFMENEHTKIDPLFKNGMLANGVALDIGLLHKPNNTLSYGISILNVNQPDVALDENAESRVPLVFQTGIGIKFGDTISNLDFVYRNNELGDKRDINVRLGMESWLLEKNMAVRGGINLQELALGASYVFSHSRDIDAQVDYAFRYPLIFREDSISNIYGTHQFSLNIKFGGLSYIGEEEKPLAADEIIKKAEKFKDEGKYEEGIKLCQRVLEENGGKYSLDVNLLIGNMYTQLGQYEEAYKYLSESIKIAPQDPRTHYEMGLYYKQYGTITGDKNLYNKAIIEFKKVSMIQPGFKGVEEEISELSKGK